MELLDVCAELALRARRNVALAISRRRAMWLASKWRGRAGRAGLRRAWRRLLLLLSWRLAPLKRDAQRRPSVALATRRKRK